MTETHTETSHGHQARRKGQDLIAEMRAAAGDGRLKRGVRDIEPTSDQTFDDLELAGQQYARSSARGDRTVPITIRMDPEVIDELKTRADKLGVRGYQTLIKQWINDRLTDQDLISATALAEIRLGSVGQVIEAMVGRYYTGIDQGTASGLGMGAKYGQAESKTLMGNARVGAPKAAPKAKRAQG
jgi:predicted DNA binding CopG/RHH family protein